MHGVRTAAKKSFMSKLVRLPIELMIGLEFIAGVLTRTASGFGIPLMALLLASAGYPGPHVPLWRFFLRFAPVVHFYRKPEARWSLMPRLRCWL
jgi:hypothetical protein